MKKTALNTVFAGIISAIPMASMAVLPINAELSGDGRFGMEATPGFWLYTDITTFNGIRLGTIQTATGSHTGAPDGSESPDIDEPWSFFSNTGMHQTTSAVNILTDDGGGNVTLDFSGWNVTWNAIESIPMGEGAGTTTGGNNNLDGEALLFCGSDCSSGDTFTLEYSASVPEGDPSGFGGVSYQFELMGTISIPGSPPVAVDDPNNKTILGNDLIIDVLANDNENGTFVTDSVATISEPTSGSTTDNPDNTITFTPGPVGTPTFTYTVDNENGTSNEATVTVDVQSNIAPTANDDLNADGRGIDISTAVLDNEGGEIIIDVLGNDTDANNEQDLPGGIDSTSVTVISQPSTGTCTANPDGTINYAQTFPYVAVSTTCTYEVSDIDNSPTDALKSNTATVEINISSIQSDWDANLDTSIIPILQFDNGVRPSGVTNDFPDSGSFFSMAVSANTTLYILLEKGPAGGLVIGHDQPATGTHNGLPTGDEESNIDLGWNFFGNTGLHFSQNGGIVANPDGTLKFGDPSNLADSRWFVTWNGIPAINMGSSPDFIDDVGFAAINCDVALPVDPDKTDLCSDGSKFQLDYEAHVPIGDESGFGGVPYGLYMEGTVRFLDGTAVASVGAPDDLSFDRRALGDVPEDTDVDLQCVGGCFDYTITGVGTGNSVSIAIPLAGGVPNNPVLRVHDGAAWVDFNTSGSDTVKSAAAVEGDGGLVCPAPGDDYGALTTGHQCLEITIQDNGLNDKNPDDGDISDPSGLSSTTAPFVDNRTSGTGGCSISNNTASAANAGHWWLLAGFLGWLGWNRRKARQH